MLEKFSNLPERIKVGNIYIGKGEPTFFVADMGANHNGDYYLAKKTIDNIVKTGAHAVKLQKRSITHVAAKELRERLQTKDNIFGKTYEEYRNKLELSLEDYVKLKKYAEEFGLIFFATPFDKPSVDFLEEVGVSLYKIASQDVTHLPLVEYIAQRGKPVILSVGAATFDEIDQAVDLILNYNKNLLIQYCVSIYPTPDDKLNMATLKLIQERYSPLPVGYSGHEADILPSLAAVNLGACSIERHFTLDKLLPGPDHATVSLEMEEFKNMVDQARRIKAILGSPEKKIQEQEASFRSKHGKSLVTTMAIPAGTVITADMVTCKSPGYGIGANMLQKIIGKRIKADLPEDVIIVADHVDFES